MVVDDVCDLVGSTPLLKLPQKVHGLEHIEVYAKLEMHNPWGSVKDRTAVGMLHAELDTLSGKKLIESSSGNTAKALQMVATTHNASLEIITNRIKIPEIKDLLIVQGVDILELPGKSDCYDPNDPDDPVHYINQRIGSNPRKYIFPNQYFNQSNTHIHYDTTGQEIAEDLGTVDYFVGGLGTTGSTLGIANRLQEDNSELKVIGVVAEHEDFIPGIRTKDEILEVGLFDPERYDAVVAISSYDALDMMRTMISGAGMLAGPTSGAALLGLVRTLEKFDIPENVGKKAVFVTCDRVESYMSYIKERKPQWFGLGSKTGSWKDDLSLKGDVRIKPDQALEMIDEKQPLIIDMRQLVSFQLSRITGSINMPFEMLDRMIDTGNPFADDRPLLFVCAIGEKSDRVASYLSAKRDEVFSLEGGLTAWRNQGLPLQRKGKRAQR